jgi:hypothetical protein
MGVSLRLLAYELLEFAAMISLFVSIVSFVVIERVK